MISDHVGAAWTATAIFVRAKCAPPSAGWCTSFRVNQGLYYAAKKSTSHEITFTSPRPPPFERREATKTPLFLFH